MPLGNGHCSHKPRGKPKWVGSTQPSCPCWRLASHGSSNGHQQRQLALGPCMPRPPPSDHLQLIKEDTLSWWQRKHSERTSWLCPCKVGSIQSSSLGVHKPLCEEVAVVVTPGGWGNGHSERPWQCPSSCLRTSALSAQQAPPLQVPTAHVNLQVGRTKSPSMRTRNLVHQFQKEFWAGAGLSVMPPPQ